MEPKSYIVFDADDFNLMILGLRSVPTVKVYLFQWIRKVN